MSRKRCEKSNNFFPIEYVMCGVLSLFRLHTKRVRAIHFVTCACLFFCHFKQMFPEAAEAKNNGSTELFILGTSTDICGYM